MKKQETKPSNDFNGSVPRSSTSSPKDSHDRVLDNPLAKELAELRTLIAYTYDWLHWIAPDGHFIYMSPSCERITGYRPDEFLNNPALLGTIVHPEDQKLVQNHFQNIDSSGPCSLDFRICTRAGEIRWIAHSCQAVFSNDGRWLGRCGNNRDITERKRAEEELHKYHDNLENLVNARTSELETKNRLLAEDVVERKRIEAEFRSIAKFPEENPNPIFRLNLDRNILYSNPAGNRLLKVWGIEVGSKLPQIISEKLGGDWNLAKPLTLEIPVEDQIYALEVVPVAGMDYINIYGMNITKRKLAEQLSQQYIAQIEHSNQELDRFAHVISHDLQAPLRSIIGFIQLLEQGYAAKLDATAQDYIKTVVESGRRMQTMIVEILDFARLKANKQDMKSVDCEALLKDILADLKFIIDESKAVITHDKLPVVVGVQTLLTQVFTNLVDNALKFHGLNAPRIHISTREEEKEVVCSVKDNGIGINPKNSEKIFQLFGRLHTEKEYPGHGIGLSTCKKIINLHGGKIWAESKVGEGTTIFFTIPKKSLESRAN